jgi:hypothetical protein
MFKVASCWIYIGILLGAHHILHIGRIRVNIVTNLTTLLYMQKVQRGEGVKWNAVLLYNANIQGMYMCEMLRAELQIFALRIS